MSQRTDGEAPGSSLASFSRRDFLASVSAAVVAGSAARSANADSAPRGPFKGPVCLFSKPLPEMDWSRLAKSVKPLGFDGIDLTVRKGGHVRPERAAEDLPKAVATIREQALEVPMITTELVTATDPTARPILSTAGKLSIPFFKTGYYRYDFVDVRKEVTTAGNQFRGLVDLGKQFGVQAGFHNHEGYIGAALWDIASVMDTLDPRWAGYYFDIRHATAEGGVACWKISTDLVAPRLKMVAVKDSYWEKTATKGWRQINCPLGEGMVNWKYFFQALARAGFHGPISLHLEYEIPGATAAVREENTLAAARRELEFIKAHLREAYGTG